MGRLIMHGFLLLIIECLTKMLSSAHAAALPAEQSCASTKSNLCFLQLFYITENN